MKNPSQEDLLGYVLGALDAQEQRDVQRLIDADPELEEKLLEIKSSLAPLDCLDGAAGPRPGLARRTSELVANCQKQLEQEQLGSQGAIPITDEVFAQAVKGEIPPAIKRLSAEPTFREGTLRPSSWSLSDMLVGVAAVAVVAAILLPAVSYSRFNSRVIACQNNLRSLGMALMTFSNMNERGEFPSIPTKGTLAFSGSWATQLKDACLIESDDKALCPGREDNNVCFQIPSRQQIANATGCNLERLRRIGGGGYGYSLGYMENGHYRVPRNLGRASFVLLSDMPSQNLDGRRSANHGGYGQNCVFEDGHIEFIRGFAYGEDPIFMNDQGIVAPGICSNDSVIAPSHISPAIHYSVK